MLKKMVEELQKTVDQIRFGHNNGDYEYEKMYLEIWNNERLFAEKVLGVKIAILRWEVAYEVEVGATKYYRTDWEALEK